MKFCFLFSITFSLMLGLSTSVLGQAALNMTQIGHWEDASLPDADLGGNPFSYSGGWGVALDGREYAVMGSSAFIHFFDVTDPANIVEIRRFPGESTTVWREFRSYQNFVYAVSDNTAEGLYVFDLSDAPDTVYLTKHDQTSFQSSHSLYLDTATARLYLNGCNAMSPGSVVMSLENPENPAIIAAVQVPGGYIHDSYSRDNILYANSGYEGLYIFDMADPSAPVELTHITTNGYNHSSWLTTSGQYLVSCDEVPVGLPMQIYDVSDVVNGNLELVSSFRSSLITVDSGQTEVTYHNPYILGDQYAVVSSYMDGLTIFDISNPAAPVLAAYYDTYPENTDYQGYGYKGCWGAYPYLPSKNILAFDITHGLFVLESSLFPAVGNADLIANPTKIFPNPVTTNQLAFELPTEQVATSFCITNPAGATILEGDLTPDQSTINLPQLADGLYVLHLKTGQNVNLSRFVVAKQ
jgi:choice-of-anchor B domain-containing protein